MNTFNNKPEKWAQEIEIKQKERPMKLQRDPKSYCCGLFIKALELCRDDVDGNSNKNGISTMDSDCRDVQEVEGDDIIDGGLEAFLDLYNKEFKRRAWPMTTTTTNVIKTTMTTSTINFKGWERWENMINE